MRVGQLFGVEIRLDFSVVIIFGLIVYSLAAGVFADWHPSWSVSLKWSAAFAAGVLFLVSLLLHELAHSVVAKARGIPVPRITLFLFGGVSEMQHEPKSPGAEFIVAIVGPITSLVIGAACVGLALWMTGTGLYDQLLADPERALSHLKPWPTLLLWLGPINIVLGVFNMIPGFPLDGGRVLRAILWWLMDDVRRATLWASNVGRLMAWILMGFGVVNAFGGQFVQGLWLVLIGWFLYNAARNSYTQMVLRQTVSALSVRDLMRTRFGVVQGDMLLSQFVSEHLLRSGQTAWPVMGFNRPVGLITFEDVQRVNDPHDPNLRVRDAMSPLTTMIEPGVSGRDALQILAASAMDPIPVVENSEVVGLLHRSDLGKWFALRELDRENNR
ncbi:MAG: site-2 protease family protein [Myxococcales bacterium]|nr:site-2 protease family protein [Myxococcales bacterium]